MTTSTVIVTIMGMGMDTDMGIVMDMEGIHMVGKGNHKKTMVLFFTVYSHVFHVCTSKLR